MMLDVHLLDRPCLSRADGQPYEFRSRKSWAILAYLILTERPPSRSRLAALFFTEADDPGRALRWNLSEIRRGLGGDGSVDGDPVVLRLPPGSVVDVEVVTRGAWPDAVQLPGLGAELLEGLTIQGAATFETWLLAQQRHVAAASEAILHEAALGLMARGSFNEAIGYAVRAAAMSPLDENHQALLIRLYRRAGDDLAASRQFATCRATFERELGKAPGPAVEAALHEPRSTGQPPADVSAIAAMVEAGAAAVSVGAVDAGVRSLRASASLADQAQSAHLRVTSRIALAEALVHSLRGQDEEGVARLSEADEIARRHGLGEEAARARAELGYVDFLRARYDRAELWLADSRERAGGSVATAAKAATYLGSVASDRASYPRATALLDEAVELSRRAADPRREAYALSMLGRINLLRGDLPAATDQLDAAIRLAEQDHWLAFLPWPQALLGEVRLARDDLAGAVDLFEQAFARACQLGDPCWEGLAARGRALTTEASDRTAAGTARAFEILDDARTRSNRLADPYVWLDGYILDAQCELGRRHGHPATGRWVHTLRELASRCGMRELLVRSLLHGAALGVPADAATAAMLAAEIDNPALHRLVAAAEASTTRTAGPGRAD